MSVSAESAFCEFAFALAPCAAARTTCFLVCFGLLAFFLVCARDAARFVRVFFTLFLFFLIDFFAILKIKIRQTPNAARRAEILAHSACARRIAAVSPPASALRKSVIAD